jgi:hypothetical protein
MKLKSISTLTMSLLIVVSACARPVKADKTSVKLFQRVRQGTCNDTSGIRASGRANWTRFCEDMRAYLPADLPDLTFTTTSQQEGEIGWRYRSEAAFTNKTGSTQKVTFEYEGEGTLANKPQLTRVGSTITEELTGRTLIVDGWAEGKPGAEETELVTQVDTLLREGQCERVQEKALDPFNVATESSFEKTCANLNALLKGSSVTKAPLWRVDQDSVSATPPATKKNVDVDSVMAASFPDYSVSLMLLKGKWYLSAVNLERVLLNSTM